MRNIGWKALFLAGLAVIWAVAGGCHRKEVKTKDTLMPQVELGTAIGSVADMIKPTPAQIEGYGLVGGLAGTGSAYCPAQLRAYLKQYILTQLPTERVNLDELLSSKNTAVVRLDAMLPATPELDEHFDVQVSLVPGSEATSLRGGWLYKAELVAQGTFGVDTQPLGTVAGPVFIAAGSTDNASLKTGCIIGGGRTLHKYAGILRSKRSAYRLTSDIRNRLCERYGQNTARAVSPRDVEVQIPPEFLRRKQRFIAMVPATYLETSPELINARIDTFVYQLAGGQDKEAAEIALEAVGKECLGKLSVLLKASEPEVRMRAARCMLALSDDRAFPVLREMAVDAKSPLRMEALNAIMVSAKRNDAVALARRLLRDPDKAVVLAAYENLREIEDPAIKRETVGRSFQLEQVIQTDRRAIYVSRSGDPRIVLFGAPLECSNNIFVESPDQSIIVNARPEETAVSLTRKHPTRSGILGPVRADFDVASIVRALGSEAKTASGGRLLGLGASYEQVIAVLEQMCAKGVANAEFWAGPLPEIGLPVKK
ncbi:MAG: flagellar basal body P-ring protein FlgI [Solirubrobacterales bacterium]